MTPTPLPIQPLELTNSGMDIGIAIIIGLLFMGLCIVAGFVIHGILSKRD